jgi:hypothetical protein
MSVRSPDEKLVQRSVGSQDGDSDARWRKIQECLNEKPLFARFVWDQAEVLGSYTDAQWLKIGQSLAGIGVDQWMMVGGPFRPSELWWRSDHSNTIYERTLCDALQEMAWFFGVVSRGHRTTALEKADRLKSALEALERARCSLDDFCQTVGASALIQKIHPGSAINRGEAALTEIIGLGRQHVEQFMAMGPSRHKNAEKVHILYWRELMRLWRAIAPQDTKNKYYHLSEFLFACSQSLFPDTKHATITAFIERHFRQTSV